LVAEARRRGADVGVAVVTVDTPGAQHALHVAVMAGSPNVVHHLVTPAFHDSGANLGGKGLQRIIPRRALPLAFAALTRAFQRIENALWIVHLVDGGRAFGTIAPTATGMVGVALEFLDTFRFFINISQQSTGRFAIEADSRDDFVVLLNLTRPCFGV